MERVEKQTVVDILYKFLYEMESFEGFDPYDFNHEEVFAKAKQMEKEQIINSFMEGADFGEMFNNEGRGFITDAQQYYNETFKSE